MTLLTDMELPPKTAKIACERRKGKQRWEGKWIDGDPSRPSGEQAN